MRRSIETLALAALLLLPACSDSLGASSQLLELRLIAVEADKPAAQAGDTVNLSALHANPAGAPLQWGYALCDGASSSAALDCLRALDPSTLSVSTDQPAFSFEMPDATSDGQRPVSVGVAVIVCPGEIVAGDTHGVPLACLVAGEPLDVNDFEMGVKRIFYATDQPNQNPAISALTFDGDAWAEDDVKTIQACPRDTDELEECKPHFRHNFVVTGADGSVESFVDNDGRKVNEQVVAQFYATGGLFEYDVRTIDSAKTRFVALKRDAGTTLTLHFVIRDSRGGVSWQTRQIAVRP